MINAKCVCYDFLVLIFYNIYANDTKFHVLAFWQNGIECFVDVVLIYTVKLWNFGVDNFKRSLLFYSYLGQYNSFIQVTIIMILVVASRKGWMVLNY